MTHVGNVVADYMHLKNNIFYPAFPSLLTLDCCVEVTKIPLQVASRHPFLSIGFRKKKMQSTIIKAGNMDDIDVEEGLP